MKLNKKQKQFLFDNYYVTAKTLDALVMKGWQEHYMKHYEWKLAGKDRYGFETLYLIDNGKLMPRYKGDICFTIGLLFQGNDYNNLLSLKGGK
jgi:hypothetical protein